MSLRSNIVSQALPLLRTHSFSRTSLVSAYKSIRDGSSPEASSSSSPPPPPLGGAPTFADVQAEGVIDELFGPGREAVLALVDEWAARGVVDMRAASSRPSASLDRRLSYSADVGPGLLEAYATLAAPRHTPSIPIPAPLLAVLPALTRSLSLSFPLLSSLSRVPLLSVHPLGPLSYAWKIADEAAALARPADIASKGVHGEGQGAGPDWYTSRLGMALVYLASEAHLLRPDYTHAAVNPYLPEARDALSRNLERYEDIRDALSTSSLSRVRSNARFVVRPLISSLASAVFRPSAAAPPPRWPPVRTMATAAASVSPPAGSLPPPSPSATAGPSIRVTAPSLERVKEEGFFDDDVALVPPEEARLVITPSAVQQLASITARESAGALAKGLALRVGVESGGCHGYQYTMALTEERGVDDYVFQPEGVHSIPVVVDLVSLGLVKGSTLDFATELIGSSFRVQDNPQAKEGGSCGCGISWEAKP